MWKFTCYHLQLAENQHSTCYIVHSILLGLVMDTFFIDIAIQLSYTRGGWTKKLPFWKSMFKATLSLQSWTYKLAGGTAAFRGGTDILYTLGVKYLQQTGRSITAAFQHMGHEEIEYCASSFPRYVLFQFWPCSDRMTFTHQIHPKYAGQETTITITLNFRKQHF